LYPTKNIFIIYIMLYFYVVFLSKSSRATKSNFLRQSLKNNIEIL